MTKYWTANEFVIEFNKIKNIELPLVFRYQTDRVARIVDHWDKCYPCKLGFNISEYSGTFEEVFLKLAAAYTENHICDGDYDVLDSRSRKKEIYGGC